MYSRKQGKAFFVRRDEIVLLKLMFVFSRCARCLYHKGRAETVYWQGCQKYVPTEKDFKSCEMPFAWLQI